MSDFQDDFVAQCQAQMQEHYDVFSTGILNYSKFHQLHPIVTVEMLQFVLVSVMVGNLKDGVSIDKALEAHGRSMRMKMESVLAVRDHISEFGDDLLNVEPQGNG